MYRIDRVPNYEFIKEGRLEGEKKADLEIAKNLKVKNSPISFIMEVTGLSEEEVERL